MRRNSSVKLLVIPINLFFFSSRRRHTRWTGDWSSDVCSSDLVAERRRVLQPVAREPVAADVGNEDPAGELQGDRKSTRLNSSHPSISYAVFCLKKKMIRFRLGSWLRFRFGCAWLCRVLLPLLR